MKLRLIVGTGTLALCSIAALTGCTGPVPTGPGATITVSASGQCSSDGRSTPGTISFTVKNEGSTPATVVLSHDGSEAASITDVAPGTTSETKRVTDTKKGTYTLTCKVGGKTTEVSSIAVN